MLTKLLNVLKPDSEIAWSDARRDRLERVMLEREGISGFHFAWSKQFRPEPPATREAA